MNVLFAFFIGAVVTSVALSSYSTKKKKTFRPNFIYNGFEDLSFEHIASDYGDDSLAMNELKNIYKPRTSIATKSQNAGINLSAKTAAKIGIAVLSSKYGRNFINQQKPFQVSLLGDKVWKVKGSKSFISHVSSEIYIQKADAQILRIIYNSK